MKRSHKQKVKLARRMQTRQERRMGIPIFESAAWDARADAKFIKEITRHLEAQGRK